MKQPVWQVVIGDLRKSRQIEAGARPKVAKDLTAAIRSTQAAFPDAFKLGPEVLLGDELQAVVRADAPVLTVLTYLRSELARRVGRVTALYAGIGRGSITMLSRNSPFESEGPAFHQAREALDRAKKSSGHRLTCWSTGDSAFDDLAEAALPLMDVFFTRWSQPQWEAVGHRLRGGNLQKIAKSLGVRFQSVHKRLATSNWDEVQRAMAYLERLHSELPEISGAIPARGRSGEPPSRRKIARKRSALKG